MADVRFDLAYRYWQGLRVDHQLLPNRRALDHAAFRFLVNDTVWINVESADPGNWDLTKLITPTCSNFERTGRSGNLVWHEVILGDCRTTRFTGSVLFQRLELESPELDFEQLMLPLADNGVRVDTLLVVQNSVESSLALQH